MYFSWDLLIQGFGSALAPVNLFWALVGCLIGTLVGVLPGIGPSSAIAILIPLTTFLIADSRHHHDGCYLLWRNVWRLDHRNRGEHPW